MRILTLNYEFPPLGGGAAPASEELAANLVSRGHEVDVVTMSHGDLPSRESRRGIEIHRVRSIRSSRSMSRPHEMATYVPSGLVKARRLLGERAHDVVHSHFILPTGMIAYLLGRSADVPYVVTAHGSDVPGYNPDRFGTLHRLALPAWRRIIAGAEAIVSPSAYLARLIRSVADGAGVEVIPNGVDAGGYDPDRARDERILLTSRLFERKGVQHFLDAMAAVETDWDVVVTGEGPYREALERKAERLGVDARFTGWVDRGTLEELLETSGIYVFPSSHENCPVALQEAMAAGCAIVASAYSGTGEVIDGAGLVVDPGDRPAFSAALRELLASDHRRSTLQQAARERVVETYDWRRIGSEYEAALRERAAGATADATR